MLSEIKIYWRTYVLSMMLCLAGGCAKQDVGSGYVTILPTIRTRVSTLGFEAGDRIGLTILRATAVHAENRPMTYDGTAFTGDTEWYAARQESSTLIAYYPYAAAGTPVGFSVETDQRGGCAPSDLLGAVKRDVVPGTAPVSMVFNHLLAQVSVVITNRTANPVVGVVLGGTVPEAEVDLKTQRVAVKAGAAAAEIQACEIEPGLSYRAVLVPQSTELEIVLVAADGAVLTKRVPEAVLQSGCRYDLSVEWTENGEGFLLFGGINDWLDGGTIVPGGDAAEDPGEENGGDVLEYEGERYRTQRIGDQVWMAENLRYLPAAATLEEGVRYPEAGASAVAEKGLLYDRQTACAGSLTSDSPVRGICPPGWHIPNRTELEQLAGCEAGFFCDSGCWLWNARASKYGASSYVMSSTLSDDGTKMISLGIPTNAGSGILSLPVQYCISVRCVRDR